MNAPKSSGSSSLMVVNTAIFRSRASSLSVFNATAGFAALGATIPAVPGVDTCRRYSTDGVTICEVGMRSRIPVARATGR